MNTDFKNSDDYRKLIQSQKDGLEEMSKHEPNCSKSGDIMEDCTCPQQSTVEERLKNEFLVTFQDKNDWNYASWSSGDNNVVIDGTYDIKDLFDRIEVIIKSELQLAEQKAREEEQQRVIAIVRDFLYEYQLENTFTSDDEIVPLIDSIINQISNEN